MASSFSYIVTYETYPRNRWSHIISLYIQNKSPWPESTAHMLHSGQAINEGGDKTVPIDRNEKEFGIF